VITFLGGAFLAADEKSLPVDPDSVRSLTSYPPDWSDSDIAWGIALRAFAHRTAMD
jgi:hypothetical protein